MNQRTRCSPNLARLKAFNVYFSVPLSAPPSIPPIPQAIAPSAPIPQKRALSEAPAPVAKQQKVEVISFLRKKHTYML